MVSEKLQEVLILEDNVDYFRDDLEQVLEEAHRLAPQWDLSVSLWMDFILCIPPPPPTIKKLTV